MFSDQPSHTCIPMYLYTYLYRYLYIPTHTHLGYAHIYTSKFYLPPVWKTQEKYTNNTETNTKLV